jgi:hypothetical protein
VSRTDSRHGPPGRRFRTAGPRCAYSLMLPQSVSLESKPIQFGRPSIHLGKMPQYRRFWWTRGDSSTPLSTVVGMTSPQRGGETSFSASPRRAERSVNAKGHNLDSLLPSPCPSPCHDAGCCAVAPRAGQPIRDGSRAPKLPPPRASRRGARRSGAGYVEDTGLPPSSATPRCFPSGRAPRTCSRWICCGL